MRRTLLAIALPAALCFATAQALETGDGHDISKVNGGITAESGQHYGDLDTVNGGISVQSRATADSVETVNGGITLEDDVQVGHAETVNGGLHVGERVRITNNAETVNGGIRIDFNSRVGGDVSSVNGGITIKQSEIGGQVNTVSGDITIGAKSVVRGGIWVQKPHGISFGHQRTPRIVIGPNAVVQGTLRFDREVELFVHPSAKVGAIVGAKAQTWTDSLPPRDD
jgi:DUF4097 and DUF4098 domain-containing protein YvlB